MLSMKDELKVLENKTIDLTVCIIDNLNSTSILRNWLFDDFDDELKVVDYLAQFGIIKILNMHKISKIVEFIWRGNYDWRKGGSLVNEIKTSTAGEAYRSFNIDFDTFLTVFGLKGWGYLLFYSWMICYKLIVWSYQMIFKSGKYKDSVFKKGRKTKAPNYGFAAYVDSIRLKFVLETIGLIIVTVVYISYFVLWIVKTKSMIDTYANITTLSSQTQTASIISQTNLYYTTLYSTGEAWFSYFRALIVISGMTISYLLQDLLILLSYFIRRISIKALSSNFALLFVLDLVYAGFAIYLIIRFSLYYNVDRTLSRYEEKYYAMFLETKTNNLQPMHWFWYIVCVLIFRILYQQIYFGELGALVQIIIKMVVKVVRFLFIYFTIMLAFSLVGYGLFYDIDNYSTLPKSFNTMFGSSLGGFDFTLYDNSTVSSATAGRIYLSIYLLTSTILLLNFLIAILNDTYTEYINNGKGLQSKEIIKLRAIYEKNDYYQCLVKAPNLINFYLIFLAPFVIIFKSKRLNKVILHIEYAIVSFHVQWGLIVHLAITTPAFIFIAIFIKLRNAFSAKYSKGVLDTIIRLIDTFIVGVFLSLIICGIMYFGTFIGQIGFSYNQNLIKIVEVNKEEFEIVNKLMDESIKKEKHLDPISAQKKYFIFKSFISRKDKLSTVFDPSDRMISESIIYVMVATMKQIKINIQRNIGKGGIDDSIPILVPTVMVVKEFASNIYLDEHFRTILFGIHNKENIIFDESRLKMLTKTLANKVLWDYSQNEIFNENYDDKNIGTNIMSALAGWNYETRYKVWNKKLKSLLFKSNEHWLINQFQYCKILLFNNSFEIDLPEIPEYLIKANPYLKEFKSNNSFQMKDKSKDFNENEWDSRLKKESDDEIKNESVSKIKVINIPNLIGFFLGNEQKLKEIYKNAIISENPNRIKQAKKMMIRRDNQAMIRLTNSSFCSTYAAISKYIST